MTEEKAQQIVVIALLVTLGSTTIGKAKKSSTPSEKERKEYHSHIVAGFFAMLSCSLLAEVSPEAGAYLAILISGAAFFKEGLPTVESYYTGKKK